MAKTPNPAPTAAPKRKPPRRRVSASCSFRLRTDLLEAIDGAAERLGTTRNRIVALVLAEYVRERGAKEVQRIVTEARDEKLDLFA